MRQNIFVGDLLWFEKYMNNSTKYLDTLDFKMLIVYLKNKSSNYRHCERSIISRNNAYNIRLFGLKFYNL